MYKRSIQFIQDLLRNVFPSFTATGDQLSQTGSDHQLKARVYMLHNEYLWQVMIILQRKGYSPDTKIKIDGHTDNMWWL